MARNKHDGAAKAESYRDLVVRQKSIALVTRVYELTSHFPPDERYGLSAQMRRAACSIPSNIAEGQARRTTGEFLQGISHAQGSVAELDTQRAVALELGFVADRQATDVVSALTEIRKMLNALRRPLAAGR